MKIAVSHNGFDQTLDVSPRDFEEGASPLRICVSLVNQEYLRLMKPKEELLEIGCGSWSDLKPSLGERWFGIDPVEVDAHGRQTIATKLGGVQNIPYPEDRFDVVVANQSMEHWFEFGASFEESLAEISRVLKPGGKAYLNVPIHLHGHRYFLRGDLKRIRELFDARYWDLEMVCWKPQEEYKGWQACGYPDYAIPSAHQANSWVLDLRSTKKAAVPSQQKTFFARGLHHPSLIRHKPYRTLPEHFEQRPDGGTVLTGTRSSAAGRGGMCSYSRG